MLCLHCQKPSICTQIWKKRRCCHDYFERHPRNRNALPPLSETFYLYTNMEKKEVLP
nr:MAG TPA: hypothetical protein [Microviridae sp.]